ncbi:MAG: histidine kinase [Beijerinckiaceae bacterium]|nr:histidine kinase [Beijerinckiaceae bacterium]
MPSLIRFLVFIGVIGGLVWLAMLALVTFVEPEQREMSAPIPANRLNR